MLYLISQNPKSPIVLLYPLVPEVKFYLIQICPLYHKPVPYFQASLSHDLLTLNTAGVLRSKKVSLKSVTSSVPDVVKVITPEAQSPPRSPCKESLHLNGQER